MYHIRIFKWRKQVDVVISSMSIEIKLLVCGPYCINLFVRLVLKLSVSWQNVTNASIRAIGFFSMCSESLIMPMTSCKRLQILWFLKECNAMKLLKKLSALFAFAL